MLSLDLNKTFAVLLGASKFLRDPDNLLEIPAVDNNINKLEEILLDPSIVGIPKNNILKLNKEPDATKILEQLAETARKTEDTLIIYYSGHGLIGHTNSKLYLATLNSTFKNLEFNSIHIDNFRRAINETRANKKILILDCCFSGRALEIMGVDAAQLQANIDLKGTYAIASSPSNQPSKAPKGEKYTAFSNELIDVLENGIDNKKQGISLDEIFEKIRYELINKDYPEPLRANLQDADKLIIALNKRNKPDLETMLNEKISSITTRLSKIEKTITTRLNKIEKTISPLKAKTKKNENLESKILQQVEERLSRIQVRKNLPPPPGNNSFYQRPYDVFLRSIRFILLISIYFILPLWGIFVFSRGVEFKSASIAIYSFFLLFYIAGIYVSTMCSQTRNRRYLCRRLIMLFGRSSYLLILSIIGIMTSSALIIYLLL